VAPQPHLFDSDNFPPGFEYRPGFVTAEEEAELVRDIAALTFSRVEMRGVVARRRTAHFGWTYEYEGRGSEPGEPIPSFLLPLRDRAAAWAAVAPDDFAETLVTEYPAGAPIGWHRDAPQFGDVIAGISLLQAVRMKFRPYISPAALGGVGPRAIRRTTHEITLEPRSGYLITGVARREYEHSIPEAAALRYSITFRTLRKRTKGR
jgi:DNA oxidative demethylase